MSEMLEVVAQPRSDTGKGASRRLRRTGMVPAIVYGAHKDPEMIQLVHSDLLQHLDKEAFYSHILDLKVGSASQQVILKDLQRHPAKPFILHVDFLRISADEKLKTHVPLHFLNEEKSPGIKHGGIVSHNLTEVEVTCLPKDLPEFIEIDMTELDVGDIVHLSDLKLPQGVEIVALLAGEEHDVPVTTIHGKSAGVEGDEEGEEGTEE
jgi:large subunit ribosomal protein L25